MENLLTREVLSEKFPIRVIVYNHERTKLNERWWYWEFVGNVFYVKQCEIGDTSLLTESDLQLCDFYFILKGRYKGDIILKEHCKKLP